MSRLPTWRTRWATVVGGAVLAAALGACGVPVDSSPTALAKSGVPFGLLQPSPPATTTTAPKPATVTVQIFLLTVSNQLAPVTRDVPVPAALPTVMAALVDGPSNAEAAIGLQSAVPAGTQIISATISGGVATVDLGGTFGQLVGQAQIDAVAQIVFTATALSAVGGVIFQLDGQPVAVPTASGAETAEANRSQFAPMTAAAST